MHIRFAILLACMFATSAQAEDTVARIRKAGHLTCGVISEEQDWNKDDLHGSLQPLAREICRAVAVAVLGNTPSVVFKPFPVEIDAEKSVGHGDIDLAVGVTPSVTIAMLHKIAFSPAIFFDSVGILARKDTGITSLATLAGRKICYEQDTDLDRLVQARLIDRGIAALPFPFQEEGEMDDAVMGGHCDALAAELSKLAQTRASYPDRARDFLLLPDALTIDPVTAAYGAADRRFAGLVDWTIYALIQAEASGVTRANVHDFKPGDDPVAARLMGVDWATAQALGLPKDWTVQVLAAVGNYGEIFERTVGTGADDKLPRGRNALWSLGGLMTPMPMR